MNLSKRQLILITAVLAVALVASVGVSVWAVFFRDTGKPITPDYPPQGTEENQKPLDEVPADPVPTPEGGGSINVTFHPKVTVDLSESTVSLLYANPSVSNQNVAVLLMIGELVVAKSDLITPGHGVESLKLESYAKGVLQPGAYNGELVIRAYHPETGEKAMVDTRGEITFTVVE